MRPVVSAGEMRAADDAAAREVGHDQLVARAGALVAHEALRLLGGGYGKRVVVVAGKGSNGADGRVAAARLEQRGARVSVVGAIDAPDRLPPCDLVVDAAYGTGFRGDYEAPEPPAGAKVLAVDIPSGVAADTGIACGGAVRADATVTFAALKPGLLLGDGPDHAGEISVGDIGVVVEDPACHVVEDSDVAAWLPARRRDDHKWRSALYVAAGSPGMMGAARFVAAAASRAGAGMVRLGIPGAGSLPVAEAVARSLPPANWAEPVLDDLGRCRALVVGPGLGTAPPTVAAVRRLVADAALPVVIDADALSALGTVEEAAGVLARRRAPTVLTPHDGEYARLVGARPGHDRVDAAIELAERVRCVVLLKGSTTVVASPPGKVLLAAAGSSRLATAGTGDVLAGVVGAFIARGVEPFRAAALAAHVHGRAAARGLAEGLVAGDLPGLVAAELSARRSGE